jgi:hypothetical protein
MIVIISNRMILLEPLKTGKTVTTIFQIVTVSIGINLKCWDESLTQLSYLVSSHSASVIKVLNLIMRGPRNI